MSDIEDEVHFDSAESGDEWGSNQEDELSELEDVYADNNDFIELEFEDDSDISLSEYEISSFVDKQFYSAKMVQYGALNQLIMHKCQPIIYYDRDRVQ